MISSEWQYKTNCNVPESCQLPRGLKRVAAILSYNGKDFCGFQKQNHSPSLQEQIEKAFSYVANQKIIVSCAGRTDTGVHACLLYTSPSPRDPHLSRMPSSA